MLYNFTHALCEMIANSFLGQLFIFGDIFSNVCTLNLRVLGMMGI